VSTDGAIAKDKPLSLRNVLKDLGFFPSLFGVIFGTPAVVSLLQAAFLTHELSAPLQAIVEAYQQGMAVFGALVEPYLKPIIDWFGELFAWKLMLYPHWRHVLVLSFVPWLAYARIEGLRGFLRKFTYITLPFILSVAFSAIASVVVGLLPLNGDWWVQGLISAIPLGGLLFGLSTPTIYALMGFTPHGVHRSQELQVSLILTIVAFMLAASLSLLLNLGSSSGILVLAGTVILMGIGLLLTSFRLPPALDPGHGHLRLGLTMLGGFVGAGLLYALDWVIKSYG
jgi:hypothetical protein